MNLLCVVLSVGNTVYYEVQLESVTDAKYPKCCFTVTGTQSGRLAIVQVFGAYSGKVTHSLNRSNRFDTGYAILHALLCEATPTSLSLPLPRLWTLLITVACQHKGQERIKVVKLLQELVNRQTTLAAESADSGSKGPKLELSALKPLWQLYTTLVKEYGEHLAG